MRTCVGLNRHDINVFFFHDQVETPFYDLNEEIGRAIRCVDGLLRRKRRDATKATRHHWFSFLAFGLQECAEEAWQRGVSSGLLDSMVPMDTIFVKHVRESGPAAKAGLANGTALSFLVALFPFSFSFFSSSIPWTVLFCNGSVGVWNVVSDIVRGKPLRRPGKVTFRFPL